MGAGTRRHVRLAAVALTAAATTVGVIALVLALLRPAADAPSPAASSDEPVRLLQVAERRALPDLGAPTLLPPPKELRLSQFRGRPLLIDVWGSWCAACRKDAPMLARLARGQSGVRFVGLDVNDGLGEGRAFVRRYRLDFPHLRDPTSNLALRLGVYGVPTMFLVDARGRIARTLVGRQPEAKLRRYLELLAGESASAALG